MHPSPADMPQRVASPDPDSAEFSAASHADTIRQFAFFPVRQEETISEPGERGRTAWGHTLTALEQLAEPEDWTGRHAPGRPLPILDSYLRYTYQRLVLEDKVVTTEDREHAAINTGLLTIHAEQIFGLFERNHVPDAQGWYFQGWATESDRRVLRYFPEAPEMAEYVTNAADLVFDWRRPLKLAYDHILGENLRRFPAELASQPMRARQALDHARDSALRRVRRNYKLVVPQWYPRLRNAGAQFLMPLDLTASGQADLALVVSAVGEHFYRGHTVLTLDMAYTNARLVARPDSDWLKPQASVLPAADEAFSGTAEPL
jgi:hypothetical protein